MSQEVMIAGAVFSDVPSIRVPDSNNVFHSFTDVTDTTATASDVASGKYFYAADGTRTAGTSSGGGGASNFVTGTFTTGDTVGATDITIPYTGNGYPIAAMVVVDGGAYNPDSEWYDALARSNIGQWTYTKSVMTSVPTYTTSGEQNQGVITTVYKSNASTATTYSRNSGMNINVLSSANAIRGSLDCIRFKSATTMSYYTENVNYYGLRKSTTYRYYIVYSQ